MRKNTGIRVIMIAAALLLLAGWAHAVNITIDLVAEKVDVTMPNTGEVIQMWGYRLAGDPAGSATVPGPTIRATSADDLTINLTNHLDQGPGLVEPTSIVIPGQMATEVNAMVPTWTDGTTGPRSGDITKRVRSFTHEAAPNGSATYQWATLSPGTFLIQSGTHPAVQMQMGLYATLVVDDAGFAGSQVHGQAYASEQMMLFSEIDPALHAAVAAGEYGPAGTVTSTMHYTPKYFLINGVPYTDAGDLAIVGTPGSDILVRFLNAGLQTRVPQVLEGAYMTVLAEDGIPAPFATDQNALMLPAGKTFDVLIDNAPAATMPVFDRRLAFSPVPAAPPTPTLQLLAPNGSEVLTSGEVFTASWSETVGADNYQLWYSTDNGATWTLITQVGMVTSYDWTVPTVATSSPDSLFRVVARTGTTTILSDDSDATFTIQPPVAPPPPPPTGLLVAPNGGETLVSGDVFPVQWQAEAGANNYLLLYSTNNGTRWNYITQVGAVTSYNWTVPTVSASSPASLFAVIARNGSTTLANDTSDANFTITPTAPTGPTITLSAPNGGETLNSGSVFNVQWSTVAGATNYQLEHSSDGGTNWSLVVDAGNVSSYAWTVPTVAVTTTNNLLRVTAQDGVSALASDASNTPFTIQPVVATVTLSAPNGGETLTSGDVFTAQWNAVTNATNYRLETSNDGGTTWSLVADAGNVTSYAWTVPTVAVTSANNLLRVTALNGAVEISQDASDGVFTIEPNVGPAGILIAPNGGETLTSGEVFTVQWNAVAGSTNYLLLYSTNNGARWNYITQASGAATSYNWTVPAIGTASSNCLIAVIARDGRTTIDDDMSDGPFTIQPSP